MQVINRIQRLRKHAGLVATEPVEVWLHERSSAAPPHDPRVPATSAAASNGSASAPPASAGAGAQTGNGEVFDADGPAADRRAVAVSLCSLLETQVATWGVLWCLSCLSDKFGCLPHISSVNSGADITRLVETPCQLQQLWLA